MEEKIQKKTEEIIALLEKDPRMIELKALKEKLLADDSFKELLKNYQLAEYKNSKEVQELKKKIFENKDYVRYQQLENELYFLTLEINRHFKELTDRKDCDVA